MQKAGEEVRLEARDEMRGLSHFTGDEVAAGTFLRRAEATADDVLHRRSRLAVLTTSNVNVAAFAHVELAMAPHAALNTQDIAEKARRDLLQLLEGVRKATLPSPCIPGCC